MKHFARLADLAALVGQPLADSDWMAVDQHHIDAFAEAMRDTDFDRFSPERLKEHAGQFSTEVFQKRFVAEVTHLTGVPAPATAAVSA